MELWQTAIVILSFWTLTGVGVNLARRNWDCLAHGSLAQGGGATFMADEWHLSNEGKAAMRQAFWIVVGTFLASEGLVFSAVGIYTLLFA